MTRFLSFYLFVLFFNLSPFAKADMEDVLYAEGKVAQTGRFASPAIGDRCNLIVWDRELGGKTIDLYAYDADGSHGASYIHLKEWSADFTSGKAEGHLVGGTEGDLIGYKSRTFAVWNVKEGTAVYHEIKTRLGIPRRGTSFTCKIERFEVKKRN